MIGKWKGSFGLKYWKKIYKVCLSDFGAKHLCKHISLFHLYVCLFQTHLPNPNVYSEWPLIRILKMHQRALRSSFEIFYSTKTLFTFHLITLHKTPPEKLFIGIHRPRFISIKSLFTFNYRNRKLFLSSPPWKLIQIPFNLFFFYSLKFFST